jgi:lipopolysaccharide/colanic/teichoic acid biosynthesis glycosyltransferase
MIKSYSTQTLPKETSFDRNFFLENEDLFSHDFNADYSKSKKRGGLFSNIIRNKKPSDFSSLERIRIIVDGLMGDVNEKEICKEEGISYKVYLEWKEDFLGAFNKYSEKEILQKALSSKNRKLILNETGLKGYNFFSRFIDITSVKNLVIPKGKILSGYSNFNEVKNIVLLNKVNNFRQINKQFEEVNCKLSDGGILMGSFETFKCRAKTKFINERPVLKKLYCGLDFILNRVIPKLPYLKKVYFFVTKGKDRLLSKAEVLGRLVSCGFEIIEYESVDGLHYFAAKKVKEPSYDMNPSYGPLFKMQRVGKNGKIIGVYKFRTMHPYSEYLQDYVLKLNGYAESGKPANDFRLVPWGKSLRRFWLDELPQLINVVKGELKLVGVRPVSERYFQDIPKDIQKLRLTQKPGCIPPYVALNRKASVESVLQAEKEYLEEKIKNPYFTDTKYFFKAIYNIVFKNKRSA